MNAATPQQLAHIAEQDIEERLNFRASYLQSTRDRLKCFIRMSGPLNAKEVQDMVCCLAVCTGNDIREIAEELTEVSRSCEGAMYGTNYDEPHRTIEPATLDRVIDRVQQ
jgi:hypothetical protein